MGLKLWARWCSARRERTAYRNGYDWAWDQYLNNGLSAATILEAASSRLAFDRGARSACEWMTDAPVMPPHWSDQLGEKNNDHQD